MFPASGTKKKAATEKQATRRKKRGRKKWSYNSHGSSKRRSVIAVPADALPSYNANACTSQPDNTRSTKVPPKQLAIGQNVSVQNPANGVPTGARGIVVRVKEVKYA